MEAVVVEKLEQSVGKLRHWGEAEPCGGKCWYMPSETVSVQLGEMLPFSTLFLHRLGVLHFLLLICIQLTRIKNKKHFLSSRIPVELGQHSYNVLLNRHSNNWFMLYGITHSCLRHDTCWTEGPVSVSSQVNCKWVPTSGLQYAAQLHTSTNRRLLRLTVTKQLHTLPQPIPEEEALRCDSATEDKGMGSIWPGITAFKKKKNGTVKRICMTAPRSEQHGNGISANTALIWC